jgi:hypothetical protein
MNDGIKISRHIMQGMMLKLYDKYALAIITDMFSPEEIDEIYKALNPNVFK